MLMRCFKYAMLYICAYIDAYTRTYVFLCVCICMYGYTSYILKQLQNGINKAIHVIKKSCAIRLRINGGLVEFSTPLETSRCFLPLPKFFSRSPSPPRPHPLSLRSHTPPPLPPCRPFTAVGLAVPHRRPTPPSSASAGAFSPTPSSSVASMSTTGRLPYLVSLPTTAPTLPPAVVGLRLGTYAVSVT
jgi:hypothetical protein